MHSQDEQDHKGCEASQEADNDRSLDDIHPMELLVPHVPVGAGDGVPASDHLGGRSGLLQGLCVRRVAFRFVLWVVVRPGLGRAACRSV